MSTPMDPATEREALQDLLRSPGWERFTAYAQELFGPAASLARIDRTVDVLDPGALESEREAIRSIRAESRAVLTLLTWPTQRLDALRPDEKRTFLTRRRT